MVFTCFHLTWVDFSGDDLVSSDVGQMKGLLSLSVQVIIVHLNLI